MTKENVMTIVIIVLASYIISSSILRIYHLFKEIESAKRATLMIFQRKNDYGETEFAMRLECADEFFESLEPGHQITQIQVIVEPQNKHRL